MPPNPETAPSDDEDAPRDDVEAEMDAASDGDIESPAPKRPKRPAKPRAKPAAKKKGAKGKAKAKAPPPLPGAGTKEGERLREAHRAFEVGDFSLVRALTGALASATDADVRVAAAELRARIGIDPVQVVVILACAAVLVAIGYVWIF